MPPTRPAAHGNAGETAPGLEHVTSSARNQCFTARLTTRDRISFPTAFSNRPIASPKSFHDEFGSRLDDGSFLNTASKTRPSWYRSFIDRPQLHSGHSRARQKFAPFKRSFVALTASHTNS
jgi:hypothetical protein